MDGLWRGEAVEQAWTRRRHRAGLRLIWARCATTSACCVASPAARSSPRWSRPTGTATARRRSHGPRSRRAPLGSASSRSPRPSRCARRASPRRSWCLAHSRADRIEQAVSLDLTVSLGGLEEAGELARVARTAGRRAAVHINVDGGMQRLGLSSDAAIRLAAAVREHDSLFLEGVYTHFPDAYGDDGASTRSAFERFLQTAHTVGAPLRHAAASAALLRFPEMALELVRPGIALYGAGPLPGEAAVDLRPAPLVACQLAAGSRCPRRRVGLLRRTLDGAARFADRRDRRRLRRRPATRAVGPRRGTDSRPASSDRRHHLHGPDDDRPQRCARRARRRPRHADRARRSQNEVLAEEVAERSGTISRTRRSRASPRAFHGSTREPPRLVWAGECS